MTVAWDTLPEQFSIEPVVRPRCPKCGADRIWHRFVPRFNEITKHDDGRSSFSVGGRSPDAVGCKCGFEAPTDAPFVAEGKRQDEAKRQAEKREDERRAALPLDHLDHWCGHCDANAYDQIPCPECAGRGCDDCAHHGYIGYSW